MMRISPNYKVDNWLSLNLSQEAEWQKGINIFEDRICGRFLNVVDHIERKTYAGFIVLAIDCFLIETLQQFYNGQPETPRNKSEDYFVSFLTETSFKDFFTKKMARKFYFQIRNGILHQAELKGNSRVTIIKKEPLVRATQDGNGLIVNRRKFHQQLMKEFEDYLIQLRKNSPPNIPLRNNFKKKMNYICRTSEYL